MNWFHEWGLTLAIFVPAVGLALVMLVPRAEETAAKVIALLASLGLTHHRLSLEWARLEPVEGVHDQAAIDHYRRVLEAAAEHGVHPWVCLHHFTLPQWFAEKGGFLLEENRTTYWTRHVAFVADNPGIWMDHCHNLKHARQGLVTHLMYAGVTEPYRVGGKADNEPE